MTWVITWIIDCGDGVFIGGRDPTTLIIPNKPMTNIELTLDQLQAVSGGATGTEYGLLAALLIKDEYVISTECKVPRFRQQTRDRLFDNNQ